MQNFNKFVTNIFKFDSNPYTEYVISFCKFFLRDALFPLQYASLLNNISFSAYWSEKNNKKMPLPILKSKRSNDNGSNCNFVVSI